MGSFRQISLAVLCLGSAVVFGYFVNRESPQNANSDLVADQELDALNSSVRSRVSTDELDLLESRPAPIATMRNPSKSSTNSQSDLTLTNLSPALQKTNLVDGLLPPPSQLADRPAKREQSLPDTTDAPMNQELPDFSAIAAEFDDSPISLPPLGNMPTLKRRPTRAVSQPEVPQSENKQRVETQVVETPIQTTDTYKVVNSDSSFTSKDFESKLRGGLNLGDPPSEISAAPKRANAVVSRVPIDRLILQNGDRSENRIDTRQSEGVGSEDRLANDPVVPAHDSDHIAPISKPVRSNLPFGLTNGAKTELVELSSRATTKLALDTTEFVDHVVQPGETLQAISVRYFGKPDFYLDIYLANRGKLKNPADVPEGILVKVPVYDD